MRVALLACLLVALMPRQAPKPSATTRDPFCFRPLEEFCARDKCLTYAAQLETLKAGGYSAQVEAVKAAGGDCTSAGTIGKCGPLRITYRSDGFSAQTRYFDKAGKLIAVRVETDVVLNHDACPDWTHYGASTACEVTNVKLLCKPGLAGRRRHP